MRGFHWVRSTQTAVIEPKTQISLLCWNTVLESISSKIFFFFENRKNAWKLAIINTEIIKLDMVKKSKETSVTYFFVKGKIRYLKKGTRKEL